jgi:NADH-quinone oxidoreductase subunit N
MYFDEAAPPFLRFREPVGAALILIAALFVSPLGYLTIRVLDRATLAAAASLF